MAEATTAAATTSRVPIASEVNSPPATSMPLIATTTVMPLITTARPAVRIAIVIESREEAPRARSSRERRRHEQGVVDADGQADQQHHRLGVRVDRQQFTGGEGGQAHRHHDRADAEQHRDTGGDDGAERREQDHQGDRHADQLGTSEVGVQLFAHLRVDRPRADLADRQTGVPGGDLLGGSEHRDDGLAGGAAARGRIGAGGGVELHGQKHRGAVGGQDRLADPGHAVQALVGGSQVGGGRGGSGAVESEW